VINRLKDSQKFNGINVGILVDQFKNLCVFANFFFFSAANLPMKITGNVLGNQKIILVDQLFTKTFAVNL